MRDVAVLQLNHITFAREEPRRMAEFWMRLLDRYCAEQRGQTTSAVRSRDRSRIRSTSTFVPMTANQRSSG
jgi:hypothetical protein